MNINTLIFEYFDTIHPQYYSPSIERSPYQTWSDPNYKIKQTLPKRIKHITKQLDGLSSHLLGVDNPIVGGY